MSKVICAYCQEEVLARSFCTVCGAPLVRVREQLVGSAVHSYWVDALISQGASGRIYRAHHLATKQVVALKVLLPELSDEPKAIRRFRREAEAGIRLRHPHAVRLFEFGIDREVGMFLVMELIEGHSLYAELKEKGCLLPARAIQLALQVTSVLEKAHKLGIIHRDLKPANIMLQRHPSGREVVKVCDFGTAKLELGKGAFDTMVTIPGTICGTPGYMAPEQCRGEEVDERTDIYGLGILLYKMLTNMLPFEGATILELVMSPLTQQPRPLVQLEPTLASYPYLERLQQTVSRCLAVSPANRYESAAQLTAALRATLPASTVKARSFTTGIRELESEVLAPPKSYPWEPVRLSTLELQECRNLAQEAPIIELHPNQVLYPEDQLAESFYLVKEGELRLLMHSENRVLEVDRLGPDEFLGVSAFFARTPYALRAEAARVSQLHVVERSLFSLWLSQQPQQQDLFRQFYYEYLLQELIRYSPFFDSIPPEQRVLLMREFEIVPLGRGQVVVQERQMGEAFYLIASGQMEVFWEPEEGKPRRRSRYLRPGQFFGEISLLTHSPATASVRAASNTVLLRLPGQTLFRLLEPYPRVTQLMRRIAKARLKENKRLQDVKELTGVVS